MFRSKGKELITIGFIGLKTDFEICERVFLYAVDSIKSYFKVIRTQYKNQYSTKALWEICNAYGYGFYKGLKQAYEEQEAKHQEWSLILSTPQEVLDVIVPLKKVDIVHKADFSSFKYSFVVQEEKAGKCFDPSTKLGTEKVNDTDNVE